MSRSHGTAFFGSAAGIALSLAMYASVASAEQICGEWTQVDPSAGATSAIVDVTALSADDAWALSTSSGPIHWNGTTWSEVPMPDLSGLGSTVDLRAPARSVRRLDRTATQHLAACLIDGGDG